MLLPPLGREGPQVLLSPCALGMRWHPKHSRALRGLKTPVTFVTKAIWPVLEREVLRLISLDSMVCLFGSSYTDMVWHPRASGCLLCMSTLAGTFSPLEIVRRFEGKNGAYACGKLFLFSNGQALVSANWLLCHLKAKQFKKENNLLR